jgi:uncharacterized protein (TIGR00255 family)
MLPRLMLPQLMPPLLMPPLLMPPRLMPPRLMPPRLMPPLLMRPEKTLRQTPPRRPSDMPRSMTGCGEGVAAAAGSTCRVEVRSVNNRGFKLTVRAREGFFSLEPRIEAAVRERFRRGTVSVTLDVQGSAAAATRRLDQDQLAAYLDDLERFSAARNLPLPQSLDGLLGLPGVVADAVPADAAAAGLWPLVAEAVAAAVVACDAMREAEGAALAADIRGIVAEVRLLVAGIRDRVPAAVARHRERLAERVGSVLAERGAGLSEADLTREIVLLADRSDIAEELVRLESHLDQFERLLAEPTAGRQLDFLTQELGREANTVAAKSADVEIAHAVVEAKTLIERLREQVQNLE